MNRPETGPMQFPGELAPGLYITSEDLVRILNADASSAEMVKAWRYTITPPQRARLEE